MYIYFVYNRNVKMFTNNDIITEYKNAEKLIKVNHFIKFN